MGGSTALDPPPSFNSTGVLGWAPATPSFFGHRSLVWLFVGAPFRFVVVQAPCQNLFCGCGVLVGSSEHAKRVKKNVFSVPCVYVPCTPNFQENSILDKNGHFSSQPQNSYPIPDQCFIRDARYPSWWNIAPALVSSWVQFPRLEHTYHWATVVDMSFPFFFHGSS